MTPTNDERERMAREAAVTYVKELDYILDENRRIAGNSFIAGVAWADANPKPVGDFREMAVELITVGSQGKQMIERVAQALSRVASETEARVRAETIEECAKTAQENGDRYLHNCPCQERIRALASNRSREGGK